MFLVVMTDYLTKCKEGRVYFELCSLKALSHGGEGVGTGA